MTVETRCESIVQKNIILESRKSKWKVTVIRNIRLNLNIPRPYKLNCFLYLNLHSLSISLFFLLNCHYIFMLITYFEISLSVMTSYFYFEILQESSLGNISILRPRYNTPHFLFLLIQAFHQNVYY